MPVTELLKRNAELYKDEIALVELNPEASDTKKRSFKEYDLVQQTEDFSYRKQLTWKVFDEKANRVANLLIARGVKKATRSLF